MASRRSRPRRFLIPTILAAVLAAEITGLALARTFPLQTAAAPAADAGSVSVSTSSTTPANVPSHANDADAGRDDDASHASARPTRPGLVVTPPPVGRANSARETKAPTRSTSGASGGSGRSPGAGPGSDTTYRGTNHVWIPSLGISKGVQSFPCSRSRPPDAGVYRWGCAGRNNVYLLSHAWSTFKPLHDAYNAGRLRAGMHVVYADGGSRVHTYAVIWWKVVAPTTAASWAWASLSTPSMTLQTCVGANSQYRLMVRLVRIR